MSTFESARYSISQLTDLVLQCVAVCCSVLQCVAECCSVFFYLPSFAASYSCMVYVCLCVEGEGGARGGGLC